MGVSGLTSKMTGGKKINPGVYKTSNSRWAQEESKKGGADNVFWCQTLTDTSGNEHELKLFATSVNAIFGSNEAVVKVNAKGQLVTTAKDDDGNPLQVGLSTNLGAGCFFLSLNKAGVRPKIMDAVDMQPSGLDGLWLKIETPPSDKTDNEGKPYTNIVVAEEGLLDGPPKGAKAGSSTSSSKKTAKPAAEEKEAEEEEEAEEESEDEESDLDADEDEIAAAQAFVRELIADPSEFVKNYDDESSGVTLKQANTAVFSKFKGKGTLKAKVASLVGNPKFHDQHAGGWAFDEEEGVICAPPPPKKKTGTKK